MRFDTPVYIVRQAPGTYDPSTGNYDIPEPDEEKHYVNLQGDETVTKTQDLGGVTEETITITFQRPPKRPFTSIRYGNKVYRIESSIYPQSCTTFVLKEVK